VLYRGVWYWISDYDIHSKRSLTLVIRSSAKWRPVVAR
jgi:hypothetical protein